MSNSASTDTELRVVENNKTFLLLLLLLSLLLLLLFYCQFYAHLWLSAKAMRQNIYVYMSGCVFVYLLECVIISYHSHFHHDVSSKNIASHKPAICLINEISLSDLIILSKTFKQHHLYKPRNWSQRIHTYCAWNKWTLIILENNNC